MVVMNSQVKIMKSLTATANLEYYLIATGLMILLLLSGVASAAPPTATTVAASSISTTGATLNGTVNGNSASTTVSFNYGLTTTYGSTIAGSPTGFTNNRSVSAAITGLTCGTTYNFQVAASNSAGTASGTNLVFSTSTCPTPSITSLSPANATVGAASFTLTINGTNFVTNSQIQFNGSNRTTSYVNATTLTTVIPVSDLSTAKTYSVTVVNSTQTSNVVAFSVIPPLPPIPSQCFSDTFTSLNTANWNVTGSPTTAIPTIAMSNRLRLTPNITYQKSMAQLQRWFPGANNTVVLTFDYYAYGGNGADGVSVVLSDANTTPAPGGYGGSLGYAQYTGSISGFNGGWLGIGIDEWGNFPNNNEARVGYPVGWTAPSGANTASGFYPNSVVVRGSGSGYASNQYQLLANTGTLSPPVWVNASSMSTPQRYRITFDHSNGTNGWLTVQRDTAGGNNFTTLVPTFDVKAANSGQVAVPTNFYLSLTASTGGSSNIHEIGNLNVCATSLLPVGGGLHHLQITGNASGPTCQPTSLTITACADALCTGYTSTAVSGTLTASNTVDWNPNLTGADATFTIPAGAISITKPVRVATAGTTTFGISSASINPIATNTTVCNLGGTNSCSFAASAAGITLNVDKHISCTEQIVTLTGCGSGYANTGLNFKLWTSYSNPTTGTKQATVAFQNNATGNIATAVLPTTQPSTTNVNSLYFNSSKQANSLKISYPDVGQIVLNASYTGTAGDASGSATFIVAPAKFTFSNITPTPLVAGKNFSATVTAMNQCTTPSATPNFGKETAPESVTLTHIKYQPTGSGASNGIFTGSIGGFNNGAATSNNLNWSEVGTIDLKATLTSGNYLGGNPITATTGTTGSTGAVGAFIPDHFNTTVTQGCSVGGFTYSGQPFPVSVTALNGLASPTTTVNYDGSANTSPTFAKTVTLSEANSVVGSLSPSTVSASNFTAGVANITPTFTFTSNLTAPATIKLRAVDTSNVSSATGTEGTALIRSGRVQLSNAYGSELLNLAIPAAAQYYNGNAWITNIDDKCTSTTLSFTPVGTDITGKTCVLESANNSGKGCAAPVTGNYQFLEGGITGTDSNGVAGFAGNFNLWLKATGSGNAGALDVTADVASYLQFNWRGLGNANPTARASFGLYKGDNKVIYSRELY
jgi:MSHA biogenesis protein MshQ